MNIEWVLGKLITEPAAIKRLVELANAARWPALFVTPELFESAESAEDKNDAEARLDAMFETNQTLAAYGTLAPGKPNHHIVAPYGGSWSDGAVEGELGMGGWGTALGYAAFRPHEGGSMVDVKLLKSALLPYAWTDIDTFEGAEYQRILVPVLDASGKLSTVANLYACFQNETL